MIPGKVLQSGSARRVRFALLEWERPTCCPNTRIILISMSQSAVDVMTLPDDATRRVHRWYANCINSFAAVKGGSMARVVDVAEYVLERTGFVSTMKLQKLVFYSQALSLVHEGTPLFNEDFQAWVNGPVCPKLFRSHRGKYVVGPGELTDPSDTAHLTAGQKRHVDEVVRLLGHLNGQQLSGLTHSETPWLAARAGYPDGEPCNVIISKADILAFYSSSNCLNPLFKG